MSQARSFYQQSQATSWTRVDMLLALYNKTVQTLEAGIESLSANDTSAFDRHQLMAFRCITAIIEGIDPKQGPICENILQLCTYAIRSSAQRDLKSWQNAHSIIMQIRDSFFQIREEAIKLELDGEIPPLNSVGQDAFTVV